MLAVARLDRPTERFGGASDFRFLVDDLGRTLAGEILGVSWATFDLWYAGDAEAPQMACMALYPWTSWYLQVVEAEHANELEVLRGLVRVLETDLRAAQLAVDLAARRVDYGASNAPLGRSIAGPPFLLAGGGDVERAAPAGRPFLSEGDPSRSDGGGAAPEGSRTARGVPS